MIYHCYHNPAKSNNTEMINAFASGARIAGHEVRVLRVDALTQPEQGACGVFYGVDVLTLPLWQRTMVEGTNYVYLDNGYFASKWHGGQYYRMTRNAMQHRGDTGSNGDRWRVLGLKIHGPRMKGRTVLIALQSEFWYKRFGTTAEKWVYEVGKDMAPYTKGNVNVLIRPKTEHAKPIDWDDIYCVVTHSSNVAVDGLLEGVPCFTTSPCAARTLAGVYPRIDDRPYPDHDAVLVWACSLADNQWTLQELGAGVPWRKHGFE